MFCIKVIDIYKPVLKKENHFVMLKSGRNAGKSWIMAQVVTKRFFEFDLDVLVTRKNRSDLKASMYNTIMAVMEEEGLKQWTETKKKPLRVINKFNGNIIHFEGIGGSDLSRTRSNRTEKLLSTIIVEETQQLKQQANIDHMLATYRRLLDPEHYKVILAFNPPRTNAHWVNEFYRMKQHDEDWLCLWVNWTQIKNYLNHIDIREMLKEKETNPDYYRWMYLGETEGLFGGVYHTFNRDIHLIEEETVWDMINKIGVYQMLIGVDSAVTVDKVAVIPLLMLRNGQCIVTEYFYHDPEKYGQIPDERLVDYIFDFLDEVEKKYKLDLGRKPMHLVVDSANANLVKTLQYHDLRKRYRVWSYSQKKIFEMARIVQDAFSKNVVFVSDNKFLKNYITGRKERIHPLVNALESVRWNEDGTKLDPIIPNDTTDALTYALATYFKNPNNLNFPTRYGYYKNIRELEMNKEE